MDQNTKSFLATEEYQRRREELSREINSRPVKIDRACFAKTPAEKEKAKEAKKAYKKMLAEENGKKEG
jgi:hypothetical protein